MGKSTFLDKIIHSSNSEHFFIKIILKNFIDTLGQIKKNEKILEEQNIILKILLPKNDVLEISILENLAKKKKLIFMFDGVDQVSFFKEQVKILIKTLEDKYKGNKILITTRNSLKEELEDYFHTISFDLNNFSKGDQVDFMVKYWQSKNIDLDEDDLKEKAELIIKNLKLSLTQNITQLIGIPMQTKMIADIYLEKLIQKIDIEPILMKNISHFYHEFVEASFRIKLLEKKDIINPILMQVYCEENKEVFYKQHINLSLNILLNKKSNEILDEEDMLKIGRYGLVTNFRNKTPIFLHQSFAEYFLAKCSLIKLQDTSEFEDEVITIASFLIIC